MGAQKITRKGFIKASAATGAVIAGTTVLQGPILTAFSEDKENINKNIESGKWISSSCQGCTAWCPVQVYVENGRAIKVRGNPNSKATRGSTCPRPHLAIQQLYDPDRVKVPMKRTNPKKGRNEDPMFVPISWDEAIDTITDKLLALRNNNEIHKFTLLRGRYTGLTDLLYKALPSILGTPNSFSHSSICAEAEKFGPYYTEAYWSYRDYDLDHTRYLLMWSTDPIASNRQASNVINKFGDVLDTAKMAVIDPRLSATAAKADEWLPVIPGEDGALVMAIAHVILTEGLWYKEFVGDFEDGKNRFIKGQIVDETTFIEDKTYGLVKWWNLELKDKDPEWAEAISGIPAEQIYRVARGFAEAAPRAISWVSPGSAMQIRGGYICLGAHALNGLVGSIENIGGTNRDSSVPTASTPKMDDYYDDIATQSKKYEKIDQRGRLHFPAMASGVPGSGVITNNIADAIINEDPYDVKMAIGYWNNFAFSCTGAQRWEQALEKLDFYAHITINPAEMTQYADIVLPACHQMFERWGFVKSKQNMHSYASIEQPVMERLWDSKIDESEITWLIAESLASKGFPNLLNYYKNEFVDPETGKHPVNGLELSLYATKMYTKNLWDEKVVKKGDVLRSWDEFLEKGIWDSPRHVYKKNWEDFGTETGKFEFYSETLKKALTTHANTHNTTIDKIMEATNYSARGEYAFIPHYEEPIRYGDENDYPLIFSEHRSRLNREGRSANTTWYQEFKDSDPGDEPWDDVLKINPIDCKKYGIKNGDRIRITSVQGSIEVTAKEWEGTRPGVAVKCYGQGHWAYGSNASIDYAKRKPRGGNNNEILPSDYERLSSATARHGGLARIRIEKI